MINLKTLLEKNDLKSIELALIAYPHIANQGIALDENNPALAHPLHRISDLVYSGKISDDDAVLLAKLFIEHGAAIDGVSLEFKKDSPLLAACSLHADKVAIFLIDKGANIHHGGCHGGTALHWSAWCGRPIVLRKLIEQGADIHRLCIDFKSTPLFWAMHGLISNTSGDASGQEECLKILIENGADKNIPNADGTTILDLVEENKLVHLRPLFSTI